MNYKEFNKNLEDLKSGIKMTKEKQESLKFLLMQEIKSDLPSQEKIPVWLRITDALIPQNLSTQPVAVFSLVLGLFLVTSFAAVNASINTLPGDALYPIKITAENVKYNLAWSDNAKAVAAMSMVQNRVGELKMIVAKENNDEKEVQVAAFNVKNSLNKVKDNLQNISANAEAVATVKEIDKKLAILKGEIKEVASLRQAQNLKENGLGEELTQVAEDVEEATQVVMAALEEVQSDTNDVNTNKTDEQIEGEVVEQEIEKQETKETEQIIEKGEVVEENEITTQPIIAPDFKEFLGEEEKDEGEFDVKIGE